MKNMIIGSALLCLLAFACKSPDNSADDAAVVVKGDTVTVAANSIVSSEIKIQTVKTGRAAGTFTAFGTVRAQAGKLANVGVPFDGRSTKAFVRLGQKVKAGQPLFGFFSAEIAELANACFQARSASNLAARDLERKKELQKNGIVSQRELEEAQSAADIARQEFAQSSNTLKMLGIDVDGLLNGSSVSVVSPISGEVMACEVIDGQYVKADTEPLVTVADLGTVWVEAQVKEPYINELSNDCQVLVIADSDRNNPVPGRIHYISRIIDESTRSIRVTIECDNAQGRLRPGMYVRAQFLSDALESIVIPSSAVMQGQESSFVYVKTAPGTYLRRNVEVATIDADSVRVLDGLSEGEQIIVKGGIFLIK